MKESRWNRFIDKFEEWHDNLSDITSFRVTLNIITTTISILYILLFLVFIPDLINMVLLSVLITFIVINFIVIPFCVILENISNDEDDDE